MPEAKLIYDKNSITLSLPGKLRHRAQAGGGLGKSCYRLYVGQAVAAKILQG